MNHRLSVQIPEEIAAQLPIPKMTLLSLYADVFKHGDYTGDFPGMVKLSLADCPNTRNTLLVLTVYNLPGGKQRSNGSGFGLKAVINVLSYYFGEDFRLYHEANENEFSLLLTIDYGQ
jgi:LytS/YehU family sensor histidine kinase